MAPRFPNVGRPRIPPRPAPEDPDADARERILRTAYELFTQHGLNAVGVDRIVAEAGVAKTTLYRHFRSKDALSAAVVQRHHQLWLRDWLEPQALARGDTPAEQLIAVFETLDLWFEDKHFQGCLLIDTLLEVHDRSSTVARASLKASGDIYALLERLAVAANAREPERLARQLHLLVRGAVVAATEGRPAAVREAGETARLLVDLSLRDDS